MALDGIFLYNLKKEISEFAVGARIDKIHQPSKEEVVLSLRSREGTNKLLLSCRADSSRIHFTEFAPENPAKPPMLCMLLRKHLVGSRIEAIGQDGLERILKIKLLSTNELGDKVSFTLVIEIMGRYSNIILLDKNSNIIDSLKRIDEDKSQVRQILPGIKYVAPPRQDKLNILECSNEEIIERLKETEKTPSKALQSVLMGVSPIITREFENGVSLDEIRNYAENPVPTVLIGETLKDFSFMPIKQYGNLLETKEFDTLSKLLDFYFYEKSKRERIRQRSNDLFKTLSTLEERAIRKAENRRKELEECKDKEKYRIYGDLISSNQYALQKGSPYYDIENYYDNNNIIRIPADVALSPSQNAQKYYKEYRKKQIAETKLSGFISEAQSEAKYLDSVIDALSRTNTDGEITEIKSELFQMGYLKGRSNNAKTVQKSLKPMKFESTEGYIIYVGRNNIMNDKLTLKTARNSDLWFHIKDGAGSHVVVVNDGREFTDKLIREAALLAAKNSKAKDSSNVAVDYTEIKNVKKPSGAKPGMVIYVDYKTEYVTPNDEELERIKKLV